MRESPQADEYSEEETGTSAGNQHAGLELARVSLISRLQQMTQPHKASHRWIPLVEFVFLLQSAFHCPHFFYRYQSIMAGRHLPSHRERCEA